MNSLHKISLLLASSLIAVSVHAADLTQYTPKVEYSADQTMETPQATMSGKVFATPVKERREMNISGQTMIMIMRRNHPMSMHQPWIKKKARFLSMRTRTVIPTLPRFLGA